MGGCGGIFNDILAINFPQSVPVKEFRKSVENRQRYRQKSYGMLFSGHGVVYVSILFMRTRAGIL